MDDPSEGGSHRARVTLDKVDGYVQWAPLCRAEINALGLIEHLSEEPPVLGMEITEDDLEFGPYAMTRMGLAVWNSSSVKGTSTIGQFALKVWGINDSKVVNILRRCLGQPFIALLGPEDTACTIRECIKAKCVQSMDTEIEALDCEFTDLEMSSWRSMLHYMDNVKRIQARLAVLDIVIPERLVLARICGRLADIKEEVLADRLHQCEGTKKSLAHFHKEVKEQYDCRKSEDIGGAKRAAMIPVAAQFIAKPIRARPAYKGFACRKHATNDHRYKDLECQAIGNAKVAVSIGVERVDCGPSNKEDDTWYVAQNCFMPVSIREYVENLDVSLARW